MHEHMGQCQNTRDGYVYLTDWFNHPSIYRKQTHMRTQQNPRAHVYAITNPGTVSLGEAESI